MPFCSVCSSISFEKLQYDRSIRLKRPTAKDIRQREREQEGGKYDPAYEGKYAEGAANFRLFTAPAEGPNEFFTKHHRVRSLKKRGETCDLCAIICEAVNYFEKSLCDELSWTRLYKPEEENYRVWLTKRPPDADGFLIWAQTTPCNVMMVIGAVGYTVDRDSVLSEKFKGRPVDPDPFSTASWNRVKDWFNQCAKHEEDPRQKPRLPTRVIDVRPTPKLDSVKVVETNQLQNPLAQYITLSHVWGDKKYHFQILESNKRRMMMTIQDEELPRTYKDAVTITRKLGITYLWIDSLCIIQDGPQEYKEAEFDKMSEYYSNSCLTIAASAALNSSHGCFIRRTPPKYVAIPFKAKNGTSAEVHAFLERLDLILSRQADDALKGEPLSTRGWALQERVLSRRMLYYAKDQMYFECPKITLEGENGFRAESKRLIVPDNTMIKIESSRDAYQIWNDVITAYGPRKLTNIEDKLRAVQGLAKRFNRTLKDTYLAGIWYKNLLGDLLWTPNIYPGHTRPRQPHPPSWSWVAVNGTVPPKDLFRNCEQLAILSDHQVSPSPERGENHYGKVSGACLTLQAWMVRLNVPQRAGHNQFTFRVGTGKGRTRPTPLDASTTLDHLKEITLYALIIGRIEMKTGAVKYPALIVQPSHQQVESYKAFSRLGMIVLDKKKLGKLARDHPAATCKPVNLV